MAETTVIEIGKTRLTEDDLVILQEAILKHTPMKVANPFCYGLYGECPTCNTTRQYGENYCPKCGQKIFFEVTPGVK